MNYLRGLIGPIPSLQAVEKLWCGLQMKVLLVPLSKSSKEEEKITVKLAWNCGDEMN